MCCFFAKVKKIGRKVAIIKISVNFSGQPEKFTLILRINLKNSSE